MAFCSNLSKFMVMHFQIRVNFLRFSTYQRFLIQVLILFLVSNLSGQHNMNWEEKPILVPSKLIPNFYKISDELYRSGQPKINSLGEMGEYDISTVINFRNISGNLRYKRQSDIIFLRSRINTWTISYDDLKQSFQVFLSAKKPVLVHCKHGADRTGAFIAAYRIIFQGWSKQDAIFELRNGGYGFHEKYFVNIIELINRTDFEVLKSELKISN